MPQSLDPLIRDLLKWIAEQPRSYDEVMDVWRTSCPQLTVWEDAVDRGLCTRSRTDGNQTLVRVTKRGKAFLAQAEA